MLYLTLPATVVLLIVFNASLRQKSPAAEVAYATFATAAMLFTGCFTVILLTQAGLLLALFLLWRWRQWSPNIYAPVSLLAVLLSFVLSYAMYLRDQPSLTRCGKSFASSRWPTAYHPSRRKRLTPSTTTY